MAINISKCCRLLRLHTNTITFLVKCRMQKSHILFKTGKCKSQVQMSRCPFECGAGRQLLQQTGWSGRGQAPQKTPHAAFPSQWTQTSTLTPVWTGSMRGCFHRVPAFTFSWRPLSHLFTAHKWKALEELPLFTPNTHFIEKINTNRRGQHSQTKRSHHWQHGNVWPQHVNKL